MKILFALGILLCISCKKEIAYTTGWEISEKKIAKWDKQRIKEQKNSAQKDPRLTFIAKDFLIGTKQITNGEFKEFLNSYEAIFGKDTLYQLGFDSIQVGKIRQPSLSDSIATNISQLENQFDELQNTCKRRHNKRNLIKFD